ncbi:MAG: copper resistance protein CopC, partial [Corynebacterium sp.]|uniref:copper resistance CopC family protein n=1 Tax=Corynebacterium sp. TaxID=1720 RepID=UPI00184E5DEB
MNQSPIRLGQTFTAGAVVAGLGVASMLMAPVALAHDSVIGGTVTEGDVLDEFPEEITLEFSGIPREGFNNFAITDQDSGELLFSEEPEINDRELTITTPDDQELGDGSYLLGFQITSSDGHATRGGVSFSAEGADDAVAAGSAETESAEETSESAAAADSEETSTPTSVEQATEGISYPTKWVLAGVGGLAVVAALS